MSEAFSICKMGLDGPSERGLFPKIGEKPLKKHQKLGNST